MKIFQKVSVGILTVSFGLGMTGPMTVLAAGPASVNLLSSSNFTILSKTGISTTGATSVVGNIGVSPAAATYITGFSLSLSAGGAFAISSLVTGNVYAPGYADPTPSTLTTAVSDMETAFTDAMGRTNPTATELGAGNIGGLTIAPGLYKWNTGVTIPTDVTLSGSANDVWIFQVAQNLDISSGAKVLLSGGAQAGNVFWVVAGQATLGTASVFNGNILSQTAIVLNTGAVLNGRALAQTAVTLNANTVSFPTLSSTPAPVVVTPVVTTPAVSATPATPAVATVTSAVPATSATPAVPVSAQVLCPPGHVFNVATGKRCTDVSAHVLCSPGHVFSTTTGQRCTGSSLSLPATASPVATAVRVAVRELKANLAFGSQGTSVQTLQEFLVEQAKGPAALALGAHGTTRNFGKLTKAALAEWQMAVGVSPAFGNFGPTTRAFISSH